jgi:hypothetical protein
MANGNNVLTREEKRIARACGISAASLIYHGNNSTGAEYSLANGYFYIAGTFNGYSKPYIYRELLRQFISRAKAACGY